MQARKTEVAERDCEGETVRQFSGETQADVLHAVAMFAKREGACVTSIALHGDDDMEYAIISYA